MTHIFSAPHCALGGACIGASDGALGGSCDVALYGAFGCPSISGDGGDLVIAIWREGRSGCRTPRWECGLALFDSRREWVCRFSALGGVLSSWFDFAAHRLRHLSASGKTKSTIGQPLGFYMSRGENKINTVYHVLFNRTACVRLVS